VTLVRRPAVPLLALGFALLTVAVIFAVRPMLASASSSDPVRLASESAPESVAVEAARLVTDAPPGPSLATEPRRIVAIERPPAPPRYTTARVKKGRSITLFTRPGRRPVAQLGSSSEFGSTRAFGVVERRGRWLGVVTPELANGEIGWIDTRQGAVELSRTALSVRIDLSRRVLVVRNGRDTIRRVTIGIGRDGSPTPTGRFAVTDKLPGARYSTAYGCCIVALSARQPSLPVGWTGGNRIAIHGTDDPSTIGIPSSAGCPHASDRDMRYLMRTLPLGTPVFIHA
jgi:hypothetical protein